MRKAIIFSCLVLSNPIECSRWSFDWKVAINKLLDFWNCQSNFDTLRQKCHNQTVRDMSCAINASYHCVKSVRIESYSGPYFPAFGPNTKRYSVSLRSQSKRGKIRTRITPNTDSFYAVYSPNRMIISEAHDMQGPNDSWLRSVRNVFNFFEKMNLFKLLIFNFSLSWLLNVSIFFLLTASATAWWIFIKWLLCWAFITCSTVPSPNNPVSITWSFNLASLKRFPVTAKNLQ